MAKPDNKTKKAFALSSIVGALLMATNNGRPKLTALKLQIDKAMKVFSVKARKDYYTISYDVRELWLEMAKKHNNALDEDEVEVFIEMVLNLLPRAEMKQFLGINFTTSEKLGDDKKSALLMTVLELDKKLNEMFGTKATATRDSLGLIMVKPVKIKAVKKERDKAKPKVLKMIKRRAKWNRSRLAV